MTAPYLDPARTVVAEAKWVKIAGYVLSGLCIAFFLTDSGMKLMQLDVVKTTTE